MENRKIIDFMDIVTAFLLGIIVAMFIGLCFGITPKQMKRRALEKGYVYYNKTTEKREWKQPVKYIVWGEE